MSESNLCHWVTLELTGGSNRILNNLITCNLETVDAKPQWTVMCDVNGKVITTTWIWQSTDGYNLTCHPTLADVVTKHLQHHALREQFSINVASEPFVHPDIKSLSDAILGGYPLLTDTNTSQYIPQMLMVHHHQGAIDWQKGCYLGQEIIMRAKQLGKVKRILRVGKVATLPDTTTITDTNGKDCGQIINCSNAKDGLISFVTNENTSDLTVNQQPIELIS
tara:strand:+ start:18 stop:683 length:666 start_codon:yes stop_codon:yes gene_type:complete